ncbi:MAG: AAA family ATPase, partial [Candidatus Omnitrophota bacterium]
EYQSRRAKGKELVDFEIARFDKLREISFSTKLIGRDKELAQLNDLLNKTKQGRGSLAFVFGEPGIGKSRLADELRGSIHSLSGLFCGGKCYQFEFRTPYKVFSEAIDAYIEKVKRLSQKEQGSHIKRIKDTLGELGGEVVKISPAITDLIGQPPQLVELEPEKERIRFLITVINFLTSLSSSEAPLLMFLDDLQWADDGSLEILERFAEKIRDTSTFLIVSYRDNEVDQSHPLARLIKKFREQGIPFTELPIKFFSLAETSRMVSQIIMEKEEAVLPLAQELNERTKGNPFFTLELLHSLVDSKVIQLKDEHYTYDLVKLQAANLPTTIVDAVLRRMRDLSEIALQILSYASVMGKEVQFELLSDLTQRPTDQIINSIEDGVENQLLYRDITGEENIFFMHDRIREAFYRRVPEEERVSLHRHIAEVLEEQNKSNIEPVLYDLAHHFTQGKVEDKALEYSLSGARKAQSSYAHTLAINLYNTTKEILEAQDKKDSRQYIEVLENLGEVYRLAGKFDESLVMLKECESLIPAKDLLYRARILSKTGETLWDSSKVDESSLAFEKALQILGVRFFRRKEGVVLGILKELVRQAFHTWFPKIFVRGKYAASAQELIISRLLIRLGHTYYLCDMDKTFYLYLKSLNFSEQLGPCPDLAFNYMSGGPVWITFPWIARTFRDLNRGLKMSRELGDKIREGSAYAYFVYCSYLSNKPVQAIEYGNRSIEILNKFGEYWDLAVGWIFTCMSYFYTGQLDKAYRELEKYFSTMKMVGTLQGLGWGYLRIAQCKLFLGIIDDSVVEALKESLRLCEQTKDKGNTIDTLAILGYAHFKRGEHEAAVKACDETIRLFPTYFNKGVWSLEVFPITAAVYLGQITDNPDITSSQRKEYLKKALYCCRQSMSWGKRFAIFLGYSYQVNGTYLWLRGKKKEAVKTWEKGLYWLRTNKNNPGGDKYRIAYILLEQAKFLLQDNQKDKKAYSSLIEARDLFTEMGCKLDLETANKLLGSISPEGISVDSRQVLT